ncbi:MAG: UvrD-helicase domain-containing protein [Planctomycetota bacterium]
MEQSAELNPEQRRAVEHHDGPLLCVAGPGSGKTRVMTHRIAHMIACGIPAESILAITFTNKAADEMLHRTLALIERQSAYGRPEISTFHSFCARLLRREIYHLEPYRIDFSIYDMEDQKSVLEEALDRLSLDRSAFAPRACSSMISHWKNNMISAEQAHDEALTYRNQQLASVFGLYQQIMVDRNALDFDDLLLLTVRVLREVDIVRERRRHLHRYVMIDEFQDTNQPQYLIARLLGSEHRNLCITGDPDQSIYSWRGASPENFDHFAEDFPEHDVVQLNRNYRSTPEILAVASRLTGTAVGMRDLYTENESGPSVQVRQVGTERDEARMVVQNLETWRMDGTPYRQMAVLYRVNSLSRAIEEELVRAGIPYSVVGGIAFYHRKEVKDVLAYLRAANLPQDDVALRRIINTPARGVGRVTLERMVDLASREGLTLGGLVRRPDLWDELPGRARTAIADVARVLGAISAIADAPLADQIDTAIQESHYLDHLEKAEPENWMDRQRNLEELAAGAHETEELLARARRRDPENTPSALFFFLERIALVADIDNWEENEDRVVLMTLHAAKGLEFDRVIIPGFEYTLLPHMRPQEEPNEEEERRLLYVGMTRARHQAVLSHTMLRRRFRDREPRLPSPFLDEIQGEHLIVEEVQIKQPWSPSPRPWRQGGDNADLYGDAFEQDTADFDFYDESEDDEMHPGVWLEHDVYGRGVIVKATGRGAKKKITVNFEGHGSKDLVAAYAPLRIIGEP